MPNLPFEGERDDGTFTECVGGELKSWVAAVDTESGDAFYGYTGPGYTEEFWILDVDGTRLMIAAEWSLDSPPEDIEELHTILDSITKSRHVADCAVQTRSGQAGLPTGTNGPVDLDGERTRMSA